MGGPLGSSLPSFLPATLVPPFPGSRLLDSSLTRGFEVRSPRAAPGGWRDPGPGLFSSRKAGPELTAAPPLGLPRGPHWPRVPKHASLQGDWDLPPVSSSAFPALRAQRPLVSALLELSPGQLPAGVPPGHGDAGPGRLQLGRRSPTWSGFQSSVSGRRSSPSELLELQPELELGLGLGPAKQAKRKGLPGKIPFRELSRRWSGEGSAAAPSWRHLHGPGLGTWSLSPRW